MCNYHSRVRIPDKEQSLKKQQGNLVAKGISIRYLKLMRANDSKLNLG
jgi:hypothetical protein